MIEMNNMIFCALILNYNDFRRSKDLALLLDSYGMFNKVLIVDNCSTDGSFRELQKIDSPSITTIRSDFNGGYGYGNNFGIRHLAEEYSGENTKRYILLANPDTTIAPSAIEEIKRCFMENANCLACAPFQLNSEGIPYLATAWPLSSAIKYMASLTLVGSFLFTASYTFDSATDAPYMKVDCLSGALLALDVDKFFSIGCFHDDMFLFCEETSIGLRAKGKFELILCLNETYRHEHSASIKVAFSSHREQLKLLRKSKLYVVEHDYRLSNRARFACKVLYFLAFLEAPLQSFARKVFLAINSRK